MDFCDAFVCRAVASFVSLTLLRCDQIVSRSEMSHITLHGTAVFGSIVFWNTVLLSWECYWWCSVGLFSGGRLF